MLLTTLLALATASLASAHFTLQWPPSAGFDEDQEPTSPCGGATVVVNSSSPALQVDQFAVSIWSGHPAGEWAFQATTDTAAPFNFTPITSVVNTSGTGAFCLTQFHVPNDWAGKSGVIQVIDKSSDGMLYQCAPVNFVAGSNTTTGSSCSNATGFSAVSTNLQGFAGSSSGSSSTTGTATHSASSTAAAAAVTGAGSLLGLGLLAAGLAL